MPTSALICRAVLAQASTKWPGRDCTADGIMSSQEHKRQNPYSDHDWGNAVDLTHDPEHGCDAHAWAQWLVKQNFPWVNYVISNRRIWSTKRRLEGWRIYNGPNPHVKHVHVSIYPTYRDRIPTWFPAVTNFHSTPKPPEDDVAKKLPILRRSKLKTADHFTLQGLLNARYGRQVVRFDGYFGSGTESWVKSFQRLNGLIPDGIVGPNTWRALLRI